MKKLTLILFAILSIAVLSPSMSEAQYVADSPYNLSFLEILTNFNAYGDHAVITYDGANGFFAVVLDAYGVPYASSATFGYYYIFAYILSNGSLDFYGSNTGYYNDWYYIGRY